MMNIREKYNVTTLSHWLSMDMVEALTPRECTSLMDDDDFLLRVIIDILKYRGIELWDTINLAPNLMELLLDPSDGPNYVKKEVYNIRQCLKKISIERNPRLVLKLLINGLRKIKKFTPPPYDERLDERVFFDEAVGGYRLKKSKSNYAVGMAVLVPWTKENE